MIKGRFGKFLIVATLVVALVLSFGLKQAKAESLLFPYFMSGNGVFSFLTIVDTWGDVVGGGGNLSYVWNYDDLSTAALECIHEDAVGDTTAFDLIQQTVADPSMSLIDIPLIYGDASTAAYTVYPIPAEGIEGFMTVESQDSVEGDFYGQMIVVDGVNGVIAAYKGLNNPVSQAPGDFSHISTSHTSYVMSNYPDDVVTTEWFVLVTGTGMDDAGGWAGEATLALGTPGLFVNEVVFNRDEDPRSGTLDYPVTCFDTVDRADIMSAAQEVQTANGGLWWELIQPDPATNATGALMFKIESSIAFGPSMQTISSENAFFNDPY